MNSVAATGDKRMTVREMAKVLGCNPETVKGHIRELWPNLMKKGMTTYLAEPQVTVILEKMKKPVSSGTVSNLQSQIVGTNTSQSLDFQLALIERQAHELWKRKALEQEGRAVRAEQQLQATQHLLTEREVGLSAIQRIAEAGGLMLSDRDDVLATYRR